MRYRDFIVERDFWQRVVIRRTPGGEVVRDFGTPEQAFLAIDNHHDKGWPIDV